MTQTYRHLPPDLWLQRLFDAKAARRGEVVRRKTRDVERIVGRHVLEAELRRRGYHAVENGEQIVVFCNNQPVRVLC